MATITDGHRIEDHFVDVTEMIETQQRKQLDKAEKTDEEKN